MITHLLSPSGKPQRAVILGAAGFVGSAAARSLEANGVETVRLPRSTLDLLQPDAATTLRNLLRAGDTLVFTSARAPCKDAAMFVENVRMVETACASIRGLALSHIVYVSSDAVYKDSKDPLTEGSCAEPASVHGAMHLTREILLRSEFAGPLGILRPTLIHGVDDPHDGYGPNRFRRLAREGKDIVLFGNGEERRDHVHIDDVGDLIARMVIQKSTGVLNAVSGSVASFKELAEFTADKFTPRVHVVGSARTGAMPHNGYREFDSSEIVRAFPGFRITPWQTGISADCSPIGKPPSS